MPGIEGRLAAAHLARRQLHPEPGLAQQRLGVGDRVRLLGSVPHADLPRWLAAADATALASTSEGLANAWIESLACGTPVVTTPNAGAADVLADGRYGSIVDDGRFGHEIVAVLRDPEQRAAMAEQGRKRAACYDERAIADQNIRVYRQAVQQ